MSFLDTQTPGLLKQQPGLNNSTAPPAQDASQPKAELYGLNRENVPQKSTIATQILGSKVGGPQTGKPSSSFHAASSGRTDDASKEESLFPGGAFLTRHTPLRWNDNTQTQRQHPFSTLNFLS